MALNRMDVLLEAFENRRFLPFIQFSFHFAQSEMHDVVVMDFFPGKFVA